MQQPTEVLTPRTTLVIGLGNPILGDDGVGWEVAKQVLEQTRTNVPGIEVDCLSLGGLSLMERMLGYEHVILVDSIQTGLNPTGSVHTQALAQMSSPAPGHTTSAHDTSLSTALKTAEAMGAEVPDRVDIVAIESGACYEFSEELSPAVAKAVPVATRMVLDLLPQAPR